MVAMVTGESGGSRS